jgi:hypothetical protein
MAETLPSLLVSFTSYVVELLLDAPPDLPAPPDGGGPLGALFFRSFSISL